MQGTNRKTSGESKRFFSPLGLRFPVCFVRTATPRPRGTSAFANACTFTLHIFSSPLLYPPAPQLSIRFLHIIFFPRFLPFVDNVRKTLGLCHMAKTLGFAQTHKGLLERSPLTARTLTQLDLCSYLFRCTDFEGSHFPCCYFRLLRAQSRPAGLARRLLPLAPLPDRNGRMILVDL